MLGFGVVGEGVQGVVQAWEGVSFGGCWGCCGESGGGVRGEGGGVVRLGD